MAQRAIMRTVIIAGALIGLSAVIFFTSYVVSPYPDLSGPPDEANRVFHPAGFSIIRPGRTKGRIERSLGEDEIVIVPDGGSSRYRPGMGVKRMSAAPNLKQLREQNGFVPAQFQDAEAWTYSGPSGKYDAWRTVFQRDGHWYEITLLLPEGNRGSEAMPPARWLPYLMSFNVDRGNTP